MYKSQIYANTEFHHVVPQESEYYLGVRNDPDGSPRTVFNLLKQSRLLENSKKNRIANKDVLAATAMQVGRSIEDMDEILVVGKHLHGVLHGLRALETFETPGMGKVENCDKKPFYSRVFTETAYPFVPPQDMSKKDFHRAVEQLKKGVKIKGLKGEFYIDSLSKDYIKAFLEAYHEYKGNQEAQEQSLQRAISMGKFNPLRFSAWKMVLAEQRLDITAFGINDFTLQAEGLAFFPSLSNTHNPIYVPGNYFNDTFVQGLMGSTLTANKKKGELWKVSPE